MFNCRSIENKQRINFTGSEKFVFVFCDAKLQKTAANGIGPDGARAIAEALKVNKSLASLNLIGVSSLMVWCNM